MSHLPTRSRKQGLIHHHRWLLVAGLLWVANFQLTPSVLAQFNYPDFSNATGLGLVSSAQIVNNRLRLTPSRFERIGAAWYNFARQDISRPWYTIFKFQITDRAGNIDTDGQPGADGIAFVIQNFGTGSNAIGGAGAGIGYEGFPSSNILVVELDMWQNSRNVGHDRNDPNPNHIAVMRGNSSFHTLDNTLALVTPTVNMSDGNIYTVKIEYSPNTNTLSVFLDNLSSPVLTASVNLPAILGGSNFAWVGFTSATGASYQNHDILSWEWVSVPCVSHNGDVDENGCVDDADLLQVLFAFGRTGPNLGRVDINCDETVDDADLLIVLFNFGSGC